MLYSSGTTGQPKGILPAMTGQPFGTGLNIDHTMKNMYGFSPGTVYLCHRAALPRRADRLVARHDPQRRHRDRDGAVRAARALSLIERHRVTHGQFVPIMFVRMLKLPEAERAASDTLQPASWWCTPPRPSRYR